MVVPFLEDTHALEASKNPRLKLLLRLSNFHVIDEGTCIPLKMYTVLKHVDADEFEWYIPAAFLPSSLRSTQTVILQFLKTPFNLDGKKASQFLSKKSRRRRRAQVTESDDENTTVSSDEEQRKRKREKKKKEQEKYKSAQFIEDSDEEYGNIEAFLEQEKLRREKAALAGTAAKPNMKATGTKKRRKKDGERGQRKKRKGEEVNVHEDVAMWSDGASPRRAQSVDDEHMSDVSEDGPGVAKAKKGRLVLSDEE